MYVIFPNFENSHRKVYDVTDVNTRDYIFHTQVVVVCFLKFIKNNLLCFPSVSSWDVGCRMWERV